MNRTTSLVMAGLTALAGREPMRRKAAPQAISRGMSVTQVATGIYAATRTEPFGMANNANSLFIINDDHVVVVDAQFTRAATLENLAALRRLTRKPVRYVINTHWHDDHVAGNQVYRDTFPDVRFIAHANTREDLIAKGRPNREGQVKYAPAVADRLERLARLGLGRDSTAASAGELAAVASANQIIRQYVAENAAYREILPDSLVQDRLTLISGKRTIEVHWFGRGNTRGDLVVWLPKERVVASGDLVVSPVPLAFGSYPTEWVGVLDSIAGLKPAVLVPGHGAVMRDLGYLTTVRRMLVTAIDSGRWAAARGMSPDAVADSVRLAATRRKAVPDDPWLGYLFDIFFRGPVLARVVSETKNGPLK